MKVINLESTFNTRDLSALKIDNKRIKENRLIRSGHLHNLTENDVNTLKNLNLKVVIDFRSEHEFIHRSDKRIEGVTYLNFPSLPKKELASKGSNSDSNLLDLVDKEKKPILLYAFNNE